MQLTKDATKRSYPMLDLSRQELSKIPKQVANVPVRPVEINSRNVRISYKEINLGYNPKLRIRARDIPLLNAFEGVHLIALQQKSLPAEIRSLTNVVMLNVSWSNLKKFPDELFELTQLRELKANRTSIDSIFERIANLHKLHHIELAETPFMEILRLIDERPENDEERKAVHIRKILSGMKCTIHQ